MIQSNRNFRCDDSVDHDIEDSFGLGRSRLEFTPVKETLCYLRIIDELLDSSCVLSELWGWDK